MCGLLTPNKALHRLEDMNLNMDILVPQSSISVTRKERKQSNDLVTSLPGPVLLPKCNKVCTLCTSELSIEKLPVNALANGL